MLCSRYLLAQGTPPKKKALGEEGSLWSTNSYFCAGAAGCCVGFTGCVFVVSLLTFESTDVDCPERRTTKMESVMEVTMKITADQVVAFEKALAAPRGPKAVWLPMPPNAAAMSPLLPLCSSTTMMMNRQTMM